MCKITYEDNSLRRKLIMRIVPLFLVGEFIIISIVVLLYVKDYFAFVEQTSNLYYNKTQQTSKITIQNYLLHPYHIGCNNNIKVQEHINNMLQISQMTTDILNQEITLSDNKPGQQWYISAQDVINQKDTLYSNYFQEKYPNKEITMPYNSNYALWFFGKEVDKVSQLTSTKTQYYLKLSSAVNILLQPFFLKNQNSILYIYLGFDDGLYYIYPSHVFGAADNSQCQIEDKKTTYDPRCRQWYKDVVTKDEDSLILNLNQQSKKIVLWKETNLHQVKRKIKCLYLILKMNYNF